MNKDQYTSVLACIMNVSSGSRNVLLLSFMDTPASFGAHSVYIPPVESSPAIRIARVYATSEAVIYDCSIPANILTILNFNGRFFDEEEMKADFH